MLKFLTVKECEALGINPEERTSGQLTVWFMRQGDRIFVQRVLPNVEIDRVERALNAKHVPWLLNSLPEGEQFVYHLGTQWYVRDTHGERVVWQRNFHDHARRALSNIIVELDELLCMIDVMNVQVWAKDQATVLALRSVRHTLFQRLPIHVVMMCQCGECPRPEKVTLSYIETLGYVPLYIFLNFTCAAPNYRFAKAVIEAVTTTVANCELDYERQKLVRQLVTNPNVTFFGAIEA